MDVQFRSRVKGNVGLAGNYLIDKQRRWEIFPPALHAVLQSQVRNNAC
jgi:hypothetical protein